ncbi:MAG TPA: glucosaminidase domain-containing protein [Povalibacter sp.]|uniref:glucosaminidase domain-containing protein n=1 Tax=Povalibacter sp. TaxID=1962978 RepID=UPI002C8B7BE1|nr:glucosaminidase domain-containing protein [Povalibacter sp.]HMN43141.1 glucosaminidase domain-containing protein [Povalibacter sp.]
MLRPDFAAARVAATLAQETARIALPLGDAAAGGARSFQAFFNDVRRDVTGFIAGGSGVSGALSLSAEGHAHRTQLQSGSAPAADRAQQEEFIAAIAPWARQAAERLGVDAELVTAHAALESGWGQRLLRAGDGSLTHNLFGLKAGARWQGDVASVLTTEVEEGVAVRRNENFRRYADRSDAFDDYAQLLLRTPGYGAVLNAGGDAGAFARGLAQGGYATDPQYAQKIERVARQVREIGLPSAGGR